ncbi:MAG: PilZ domain-containing protein [Hyphomicrobium sp.]
MSVQSQARPGSGQLPELLFSGDMRRYRRLAVELPGRFLRADQTEHACSLREISVSCATIETPAPITEGERVIAYFEHLGRLEASVARGLDGGLAFQWTVSEHKREKLAAQIMWLINREDFPEEFVRSHERIGRQGSRTTLKVDDGVTVDVELLDVSASGASIGTSARPPISAEVTVGKIPAIVRRHHENGIGVQFLTVLSQEAMSIAFP